MAHMASPRSRQHQRDGRGAPPESVPHSGVDYGRGGGGPHGAYHHLQRDSNHHEYTNIAAASRGNHHERSDGGSFVPISSSELAGVNPEASRDRHHQHTVFRNEDRPISSSSPARGDVHNFHGRGGREDTGRRRRPSAGSFDELREEHLRQGALFGDKEFLPASSSIYFSRHFPERHLQWLRPGRICAPSRPHFVQGGFERFDVKQGNMGDCWFVAAIACLCSPDHYRLLQRVIPAGQSFQDSWYAGMFRFNFWHFGQWQEVVVDDLLPTVGGALRFVHSTHFTEFWAALMEKAYAKLYGSYEALKGGIMADSLTDLTGGVAESYKLRGENANYPDNIVNILLKAMDRGALIGCGIDGEEQGQPRETVLPNGLVTGHAYSVTDLRKVPLQSGDVILIRVRNPHGGRDEWNGPWNERSSMWRQVRPEDRERFGLIQRHDGEFWMDFSDFMDNFDSLVICNLSPDAPIGMPRKWYIVEHHGRWVKHFNAGGRPELRDSHWANPQYVLTLQDTDDDDDSVCSVIIQLMQKDRRKIKQKGENFRFIGFLIYKVPSGYSVPLKKDFFDHHRSFGSSDSFTNSRQVVQRFALPPGVYVVLPCTWDRDLEADFYIRFFFEKGNVSEYADEKPEKLEVPPPIPSPKHKEQEEQFQKFFYEMSGEDMEVNCFELHRAVNEGFSKEPLHREIGLDACRSFVSLMDVDNSGRLGFTEFLYLWSVLRSWKKTFLQYDADNSGKMDAREIRAALAANGYKVTNQMMSAAIFRYADPKGLISFDNFLVLMTKLMKLFNVFQKRQKNEGGAMFTLQQWLDESLRL